MSSEKWKEHPEFPRYLVSRSGKVRNKRSGDLKKNSFDCRGYAFVNLYQNDMNRPKPVKIHRLVAEIYSRGSGETVNHKNGVKTDNRAENLEWMSRSDNSSHAWKLGLTSALRGQRCGKSKIKDRDVLEIRNRYLRGESQVSIAKLFLITQANISSIVLNKTWKHLPKGGL